MLPKDLHWSPSVVESPVTTGASYPYPAGMGFLLSSALVRRLTAPGVRLAHGVAYPYDDVMHGAWVAEHASDTDVVDDPAGFHDVCCACLPQACYLTDDVSTAAAVDRVEPSAVHRLRHDCGTPYLASQDGRATRATRVCALARVARINRLLGLGVHSANGIMSGDFGSRRMEACESSH
jgi:hypothetical protein